MPRGKIGEPLGSSWKFVFYVFFVFFAWAVVASIWQGGWSGLGSFAKAYGIVALAGIGVAAVYGQLRLGPVAVLGAAGLLLLGAWVWLADTWTERLWDLAAAILALVATALFLNSYARYRHSAARGWKEIAAKVPAYADVLVFALLFWVFASVGVSLRSRPLPTDLARFAELGRQRSLLPEAAARWETLRVGLALSGGGYRAAVFHAGVLQALEDLGIRVDNLSTVSGGSIIGAYYAVGGAPKDFVEAAATGRFNLKRSLLQIHNALRLPLPMKIPGLETHLFPWSFDRLDVQTQLLRNVLFDGARLPGGLGDSDTPQNQPQLMIAVTDLSYGFQFGLLSDGLLKLGHEGNWDVYRNETLELFGELDLADRVALSGAFPLAFPPRRLKVQVSPVDATGQGTRELLLVDGGVRDNTGHDLLRVADRLSQKQGDPTTVANYQMPRVWDLDVALVSDAGAVFGVLEKPGTALGLLPRTFDVAAVETDHRGLPSDPCAALIFHRTHFSVASYFLEPDRQFNLKNDTVRRAALERETSVAFNPGWYPAEVLRRLVEQLPQAGRDQAQLKLEEFLALWRTHEVRGQDWARAFDMAQRSAACDSPSGQRPEARPLVPGACEAVALRELVRGAITPDLEVFRATSTLDDTPSSETVRVLERLGKLLVYLRWPMLAHDLDQALACKERQVDMPEPVGGPDEQHPAPVVHETKTTS